MAGRILLTIAVLGLAGCAIQRAQVAHDTKQHLVGMRDEQVLACMGPPHNRSSIGTTEVWQYQSGDGHVAVTRTANVSGSSGFATGSSTAVANRRFCVVNVAMTDHIVQSVTFGGPTGGALTTGEQCAFVLQGCAPRKAN